MNLYQDVVLKHFDRDGDGALDDSEQAALEKVQRLEDRTRDEILASGEDVMEALSEMWLANVIDQNLTRLADKRTALEREIGMWGDVKRNGGGF